MRQLMENWRKYTKKDTELENLEENSENPLVQDAANWMQSLPPEEAQELVGLLKTYDETGQVPLGLADLLDNTPYDLNLNEDVAMAPNVKKMLQVLTLAAAVAFASTFAGTKIGQAVDQTVSSVGQSIGTVRQPVDPSIEGFSDR